MYLDGILEGTAPRVAIPLTQGEKYKVSDIFFWRDGSSLSTVTCDIHR